MQLKQNHLGSQRILAYNEYSDKKTQTCILTQVNGWLTVGDRFLPAGVGSYRQSREQGYNFACNNEPRVEGIGMTLCA